MKTTALLLPLFALLCGTRIVCTATRGDSAALDYEETNMIQNDYFIEKRNKPSLSIVNPLDVLRQRLLLEIARRQMKENTRQVELNRAILKNIGKREYNGNFHYPLSLLPQYQLQLLGKNAQAQQKEQENHIPLHLLYKYTPSARASMFDLYQRQPPMHTYDDINDVYDGYIDDDDGDDGDDHVIKYLDISSLKNQPNNKDIENETNHRNFGRAEADVTDEHKVSNDVNAGAANRLQYIYKLHKNNYPHK